MHGYCPSREFGDKQFWQTGFRSGGQRCVARRRVTARPQAGKALQGQSRFGTEAGRVKSLGCFGSWLQHRPQNTGRKVRQGHNLFGHRRFSPRYICEGQSDLPGGEKGIR
jgi:hypothetical protein